MRSLRLAAVLVAGAMLAGVGAGAAWSAAGVLSSDAIARVGGAVVTRTAFDRWFDIAAHGFAPRLRVRDYRAPRFAGCVTKTRKTRRASGRSPTSGVLRRQCRRDYEHHRNQVLDFLITERWVAGEAVERGVALSADESADAFRQAKRETFGTDPEFRKFLLRSGMTDADARFQVAYNTLYAKLQAAAIANVEPVSDRDVQAYYSQNRQDFARPELRDLRVVLTRTRSAAVTARSALERGQSWRHVARKHSIDRASRNNGGKLTSVAPGTLDDALDRVLFRAPRGKLRGPHKGRFGYFVFKILKISPARQQTLAQASPAIRQLLTFDRQSAAAEAFDNGLRAKWKPRTACRRGFVVNLCAGTPESGERPPIRPMPSPTV